MSNEFKGCEDAYQWLQTTFNLTRAEAEHLYITSDCPYWYSDDFCNYNFLT